MSDKGKSRVMFTLTILATLAALGAVGVNAGVYSERINQNAEQIRTVKQDMGQRLDRMQGDITDIRNYLMEDRTPR